MLYYNNSSIYVQLYNFYDIFSIVTAHTGDLNGVKLPGTHVFARTYIKLRSDWRKYSNIYYLFTYLFDYQSILPCNVVPIIKKGQLHKTMVNICFSQTTILNCHTFTFGALKCTNKVISIISRVYMVSVDSWGFKKGCMCKRKYQ